MRIQMLILRFKARVNMVTYRAIPFFVAVICTLSWKPVENIPVQMESIESVFTREQGWHSGESTHLPSMWPGIKSQRQRHMWVVIICLPVLSFAPRGFFPGTPVFPSRQKTTLSNSNLTRNHQVDEEPLSGSATSKFCYCLFIYLFTGY